MSQFERILCNITGGPRHEMLEGRPHLVVPMVMLTEGVHHGSNGPLYYPSEELAKNPGTWNHKPIVLYHPQLNGVGISACDPVVLNSSKCGIVLNTRWDGKLRSEAWLDETLIDNVDERIRQAVERAELMEVSTGLYTDWEEVPGTWNGAGTEESYVAVARNYRPDHLALLPDKVGACSIADGAGLFQLNEQQHGGPAYSGAAYSGVLLDMFGRVAQLVLHQMSYDNVRDALHRIVFDKYGDSAWVVDVYDTFFIYANDGELYRLDYEKSDTQVVVSGIPDPVVRVTEYRTPTGTFVGNADRPSTEEDVNKTTKVDKLIGNATSPWEDADRDYLMGLDDSRLDKMLATPTANADSPKTPVQQAAEQGAAEAQPAGTTPPPAVPTANAQPQPQTTEQYIANAPPQVREVLQHSMTLHEQERARLVQTIVANERCPWTAEQLAARSVPELQQLAQLAAPAQPAYAPVPNYAGAATPAYAPQPVANREEGLELPVMNFREN